jgi:SHS2 domain-containing protein
MLAVVVAATADVEVRPSASNPRTAVAKADLAVFEYFIGVTPGVQILKVF